MHDRTFGEIVIATLAAMLSAAVAFFISVFSGMEYGQHFIEGKVGCGAGFLLGFRWGCFWL
jgi:hypothetical protein